MIMKKELLKKFLKLRISLKPSDGQLKEFNKKIKNLNKDY